jgi:hypothetical protein
VATIAHVTGAVRGDYQVLAGTNRHTITPTGWVQEEDNLKLVLDADGKPLADGPYLSREVGVNRYEHIVGFDFSAGDHYWQRSADFWRAVRGAWDGVYAARDRFEILGQIDGQQMFEPLFEYGRPRRRKPYDARGRRGPDPPHVLGLRALKKSLTLPINRHGAAPRLGRRAPASCSIG